MKHRVKSAFSERRSGDPHTYDPEFHGPTKQRSCTDIICLILFVLFMLGWIALGFFAAIVGDPSRLLYPTDSKGQVCGRDEAVIDKPYLFFFDLTRCASPKVPFTGCPTPQVCVKECPQSNWFYTGGKSINPIYCKDGVNITGISEQAGFNLIRNHDCAGYHVNSLNIAGRCIPLFNTNDTNELLDYIFAKAKNLTYEERFETLKDALKYTGRFVRFQEVAEGVVEDIKSLWPYLILGCCISMLVSFLWIVLLRLIAKIMVWFSLVLFTGLSGYAAYFTFERYMNIKNELEMVEMSETEMAFTQAFSKTSDLETTWLVFFIVTVSVFVICLIVFIFLRKRIQIAIALINEASKAVGSIMSTLVFPLLPFVLHLFFLAIFCVVALLLASEGSAHYKVMCSGDDCSCSPLPENSTCNPGTFTLPANCDTTKVSCQFFSYEKDTRIQYFHIYNLFAFFWSMFFVCAFCEMVLAGAFSSWYWSFNKPKDVPATPVFNSVNTTLRYHIGTLAFGSLIIAIVRFIRVVFEYIDYQLKKHTDNMVAKFFMCCCRCCLWCLEKFLRFINRNAYVYCAIYGSNFCTSARKSFSLLMRNVLRVTVLDKVTDFLLFIGKLVVTGLMALLSFMFFSGSFGATIRNHLPELNYYLTPVIIITVATFFIASAFFNVYAMAVDTLFFCFLEDSERNDGSEEKPYFMSKSLMKILDKSNKFKQE